MAGRNLETEKHGKNPVHGRPTHAHQQGPDVRPNKSPVAQKTEDFGFSKGFLELGNEDSIDETDDKNKAEKNKMDVYEQIDFSKLGDIEFPIEVISTSGFRSDINQPYEAFKSVDFGGAGFSGNEIKKEQIFSGFNQSGFGNQSLVQESLQGGIRNSGIGSSFGSDNPSKVRSKVVKKELVEDEQFLDF